MAPLLTQTAFYDYFTVAVASGEADATGVIVVPAVGESEGIMEATADFTAVTPGTLLAV